MYYCTYIYQLSEFTSEIAITPAGTTDYKAPEIIKKRPHNQSVDIWSFGVCCYEIISFEMPFDNPADVCDFYVDYKPLDDDTPVLQLELVEKMLQKLPRKRPTACAISEMISQRSVSI